MYGDQGPAKGELNFGGTGYGLYGGTEVSGDECNQYPPLEIMCNGDTPNILEMWLEDAAEAGCETNAPNPVPLHLPCGGGTYEFSVSVPAPGFCEPSPTIAKVVIA